MLKPVIASLVAAVSCGLCLAAYQKTDSELSTTPSVSALAEATAELWDPDHHLKVTDDATGRHIHATDRSGRVMFDGPANTPRQRATVPADILAKVDSLDQLPGVQIFRTHAANEGVEVAIESDWWGGANGVTDGELAVIATSMMLDDGLIVVGNRPVRQMRQLTIHKLICESKASAQRIELTVPVINMIYVAEETW